MLAYLRWSCRPLIITTVIALIAILLGTEAIRWYESRVALQLQSPSVANLVGFAEAASAPIKSRFNYTVTIRNESSRAAQNVEFIVQAPTSPQLNLVRPNALVSDKPGDTANIRIVRVSRLDAGQTLTLQYEGSGKDRYVPQSQLQVIQVGYRPFRSQ